jgi:hypothetical protein
MLAANTLKPAGFAHSHPNDVLDLRIMRRARFMHANNIRQRGVSVLTKGRKIYCGFLTRNRFP